jgi:hypothetical protein
VAPKKTPSRSLPWYPDATLHRTKDPLRTRKEYLRIAHLAGGANDILSALADIKYQDRAFYRKARAVLLASYFRQAQDIYRRVIDNAPSEEEVDRWNAFADEIVRNPSRAPQILWDAVRSGSIENGPARSSSPDTHPAGRPALPARSDPDPAKRPTGRPDRPVDSGPTAPHSITAAAAEETGFTPEAQKAYRQKAAEEALAAYSRRPATKTSDTATETSTDTSPSTATDPPAFPSQVRRGGATPTGEVPSSRGGLHPPVRSEGEPRPISGGHPASPEGPTGPIRRSGLAIPPELGGHLHREEAPVHGSPSNDPGISIVEDDIDFMDFQGPMDTTPHLKQYSVREISVDVDKYYPPEWLSDDEGAHIMEYVDLAFRRVMWTVPCEVYYRRSSSWDAIKKGWIQASAGGFHLRLVFQDPIPGDRAISLRAELKDDPKRLLYDSRRALADPETYLRGVLFDRKPYGKEWAHCGPWRFIGIWSP